MQIYIMAQGQGSRWRADHNRNMMIELPSEYKQLIPISEGEVLIQRTIRQVAEAMGDTVSVTLVASGDFAPYVGDYAQLVSLREQFGHLHQGIVESYRYWKDADGLLFLYGDVIYESSALKRMLFDELHRVSFFGRKGANTYTGKVAFEMLALGVPKTHNEEFCRKIRKGWKDREPRIWGYTYTDDTADFIELDTWSDDVDSPEEYLFFFGKLKELALLDDERSKNG